MSTEMTPPDSRGKAGRTRLRDRRPEPVRECPQCDGRGYTLHVRRDAIGPDYLLQVCAICHPLLGAA